MLFTIPSDRHGYTDGRTDTRPTTRLIVARQKILRHILRRGLKKVGTGYHFPVIPWNNDSSHEVA